MFWGYSRISISYIRNIEYVAMATMASQGQSWTWWAPLNNGISSLRSTWSWHQKSWQIARVRRSRRPKPIGLCFTNRLHTGCQAFNRPWKLSGRHWKKTQHLTKKPQTCEFLVKQTLPTNLHTMRYLNDGLAKHSSFLERNQLLLSTLSISLLLLFEIQAVSKSRLLCHQHF